MSVRVEVAIASICRGGESDSIGGFDRSRAVRGECALRICAQLGRWVVRSVEYVGKHTGVVGNLERGGGGIFACGTRLEEEKGGRESSAAVEIRFLPSTNDKGTKTRKLGGALGANPLSLRNSSNGEHTVDWSARPKYVDARRMRPRGSTAPARRACGLGVSPGLVPKPLEITMENRPSAADEDSGTKRGRRGLDRSGNHGKRRVEKI